MTTRTIAAALLFLLSLGASSIAASDPAEIVRAYLRALDDKAVGEVSARATGDGPRPAAPPVPYEGVSVVLLPESPDLRGELEAVKAHARDSLKHYADITVDVTGAREQYERSLLTAGAGLLIRGDVTDDKGVARLRDVPEGDWLVLAWRTQPQVGKGSKLRPQDVSAFRDIPVASGYSIINYWLGRVSVRRGGTADVELNDRNVWLTGVREDVRRVDGTPKSGSGSNKRR